MPFLRRIASPGMKKKVRRVSVAAPSPEVDVAPGDPSVWPHGSAREGPARMTWNVSARLLATCSSGPGGPPATVRFFCLPFLGRAAAQRSDAPAPDQHPGRSGAPPIQARRHRRFTVSCHSARASEAVVVNEAGRVLLAGPRPKTLGNGGQEPTLHGGAIL